MVAIIIEFTGSVGCEPEPAHLKAIADYEFVSIAKIIDSVDPTEFASVPIGQQYSCEEKARRRLGNDSIFDL